MKYIYEIWPSEDPSFKYQYSIHLEGAKRVVNGPMSGKTTDTKEKLESWLKRTVKRRNEYNLFSYRQTMTVKPERVEKMIEAKENRRMLRDKCFAINKDIRDAKKNRNNSADLSKLANYIARIERGA